MPDRFSWYAKMLPSAAREGAACPMARRAAARGAPRSGRAHRGATVPVIGHRAAAD
jgi:hypothetical protein